jgi:hypothetical protein
VTIDSAEEDRAVSRLRPDTWLGASDEAQEGVWVWVTGEPFTYTNWDFGEPNDAGGEDCAVYAEFGTWNDVPCTEYWPFVCELE